MAVGIINQLNTQFIGVGVKFVVQVGDITQNRQQCRAGHPGRGRSSPCTTPGSAITTWRKRHQSSQAAATYFQTKFQQTQVKVL